VDLELSVVIPCLHEADTIGVCVEKAERALRENRIAGEIVVAVTRKTRAEDPQARRAMTENGRYVIHALRSHGRAA
jgi:hypothetical protein